MILNLKNKRDTLKPDPIPTKLKYFALSSYKVVLFAPMQDYTLEINILAKLAFLPVCKMTHLDRSRSNTGRNKKIVMQEVRELVTDSPSLFLKFSFFKYNLINNIVDYTMPRLKIPDLMMGGEKYVFVTVLLSYSTWRCT